MRVRGGRLGVGVANQVAQHEQVDPGSRTALHACVEIDVIDPDVVIVEARRAADRHQAAVVPISEVLARYDRPPPTIDHYDQLLEAR